MTLPWKNLFKIISTSFILAILASPFVLKTHLNHLPTKAHAQSTNICQKLGVNLAITASNPALQAAIQQANGVNSQFTEILVTGVGDNDLANVLSAIGNNNQQTIIRLGAGRQSENISAAEWADFLNRVNSQAGKPIIATAGHNEPYCAERRPLDQEVTFVDTVARDTNGEVTLVTGQFDIYCPPNKDGPTQEQYFKAISNIPGIDAVAMPFYTEVGGQNIDAAVALFQNYANQTIKPIYITEIGADPNNNGTGDPALLREALNRIFAADKDGQILAALVFNGLCQNPSFAYTQKYCSPECLPLVSGCAGGQTVSEAELASLATQCQAAQILPYDATIAPDNEWRLPEDLIEIATYPVSCASNIESFVAAGDDEILCTATGCKALGLKENVTYNFGDDIPWLTRPREIASTLQSNLEKIKASASTFFSAKRSLPGENPDAVAPLNKGTRERSQFNLIYEYLYTLDLWCQIYVQVTGSPYEACPLPRVFAESYPDNPLYAGFPFANELHFFTQRVKPLKYENLGSLTAQEQNVFWNTPPQMQDGVFFKPAYLVSYIPDPNIDFFDFTPDPNQPPNFTLNSRLKVIRFKIPSSIGEQGNLRRLQQEYGQELSVPVNYEPPYKNSTLSNTAYLLMPSRFAEKQAGLNQEDRRHDIDLVQNGSLEGPVINFPVDAATNPLVAQLIKVINKEGHVCTGPTGGEEADQITYPATFGFQDAWQFFNPAYIVSLFGQAARFTQNIIADISPLVPDKKSAPHYNYLVIPEEIAKLSSQTARDTILPAMIADRHWQRLQDEVPKNYELSEGTVTTQGTNLEFCKRVLGPLGDFFCELFYRVDIETGGSAFTGDIPTNIAATPTWFADFLLPDRYLATFEKSGCKDTPNPAECYWWWTNRTAASLTQSSSPTFSTPNQLPSGFTNLPPVQQGQCIAPQPNQALSIIQQTQSNPQKYPYASLVDAKILQAIYTIEGFTHYETGNTTCTKNPFTALGLMQVTDPTYIDITSENEAITTEEGVCSEIPGKLNRCYLPDAIELAARTLIFKKYSGLPNPTGLTFSTADAYTYSADYYNSNCPDEATRNLAESLKLNGHISEFRNGTSFDMSYPDLVCAIIGTCPPYPSRQGC